VIDGDDPLGRLVDEDDVIRTDRADEAPVQLSIDGRHDPHGIPILGFEEVVSQAAATAGGGCGGELFGIECLVETIAEASRQTGEVWMLQRIDHDASSRQLRMYQLARGD
jgi:hypothetical protein